MDRARAARHGLNAADIEDVIEATLGGKITSENRMPQAGANAAAPGSIALAGKAIDVAELIGRTPYGFEYMRQSQTLK